MRRLYLSTPLYTEGTACYVSLTKFLRQLDGLILGEYQPNFPIVNGVTTLTRCYDNGMQLSSKMEDLNLRRLHMEHIPSLVRQLRGMKDLRKLELSCYVYEPPPSLCAVLCGLEQLEHLNTQTLKLRIPPDTKWPKLEFLHINSETLPTELEELYVYSDVPVCGYPKLRTLTYCNETEVVPRKGLHVIYERPIYLDASEARKLVTKLGNGSVEATVDFASRVAAEALGKELWRMHPRSILRSPDLWGWYVLASGQRSVYVFSGATEGAAGRFLGGDGDHSLMSRVLGFLVSHQ